MRLLINALSAKAGGGQTYLANLLQNVPENSDIDIYVLCGAFNHAVFSEYEGRRIHFIVQSAALKNPLMRTIWEYVFLPSLLKKWEIELFFQLTPDCIIRIPQSCRTVTILQNMLPFEPAAQRLFPFFSISRVKMFLQKKMILKTLQKFERVIFISDYSRKKVSEWIPELSHKSRVIHLGVSLPFFERHNDIDFAEFGLSRGQFYVYVSNPDYYKMQVEVVREWKLLWEKGFRYPLVLVGNLKRKRYVRRLMHEIKSLKMENSVLVTGAVSHSKIPSLLQGAKAIIFASVCECCPNVLLENMASEKTVFCSDILPMPELGGDAPVYFNPFVPGELSSLIRNLERSPKQMEEIAKKCRTRAEQFRANECAAKTFSYLCQI